MFGSLLTIIVGIYMAQPWGDNYAYQNLSSYAVLALFLLWALTPYVYLIRQPLKSDLSNSVVLSTLVSSVLVCVGGAFLLIDTAFINIDAQGGLVLLFLPIYQWLLIGVIRAIAGLWGGCHAT